MIQINYRLDRNELIEILRGWNHILRKKVHMIACGGTAMTLLGVKASTKDIDFMVPDIKEYDYLIQQLSAVGYKPVTGHGWRRKGEPFQFDLFRGNRIHTTELLESPLDDGKHTLITRLSRLYIGVLNDYDLIVSKLMRGTKVDYEDCMMLATTHKNELNLQKLVAHFYEMISFDVAEERLKPNINYFLEQLNEYDKNG